MPQITHIKKRTGDIVTFSVDKINLATSNAFKGSGFSIADDEILNITVRVVDYLEVEMFEDEVPTVEDVQDVVEKILMEEGYHKVAKSYILYRYEHAKQRVQETEDQIDEGKLMVVKHDGKTEKFSRKKVKKTLKYFLGGIEDDIDLEKVLGQCCSEIYDGISTEDISRTLIMTARAMIERDPVYSTLAARMLLSTIYKEVIGSDISYKNIDKQCKEAFVRNLKRGVELGRVHKELLDFDLDTIVEMFDHSQDDLFDYLGLQTVYDRYFVRDTDTDTILETPQMFWMRVAMGVAMTEKKEDRTVWVKKFYDIMSQFYYTPSTPTLFHAGTPKPQLSSCYLNTVPDSLDGIFKTYADNAQLSKWSGGIGTDWTDVRGTGSFIEGTGVESQGVIPFLKIANDATVAINRSGRRRGAACVYLETWHYDFLDFVELRKNTGDERRRTHDMNTASWIPDLFMQRVRDGGMWTFFSPDEVPDLHDLYGSAFTEAYVEYEKKAKKGKIKLWKEAPALDLWKKMLAMLFETGHPWITFKDPCNIRSPQDHAGVIHNSNLCTEITLNTSYDETAVCNLGSLNFAKFVTRKRFDKKRVEKVVGIAMRMLDNVIDINYYPTEDGKRSNLRHRPVGLGLRGFQDALYAMGINFDSEEMITFADESMEVVSYHAILSSSRLAKERGSYETYEGSKWSRNIFPQDTISLLQKERGENIDVPKKKAVLDWAPVREHIKKHGMRNSNTLAIAPTATTANIANCVPSIEPIYKNLYVKSNQAGDFVVINKHLVEELKKKKLWTEELLKKIKYHDGSIQEIEEIPADIRARYKEVFEIDSRWLIKAAAYRGRWIDQSQSLNIFFNGTSGKELSDIYMYAWEMGLKTTYYLRSLAASQVEKSTVDTATHGDTHTRKKTSQTTAPEKVGLQPKQEVYDVCESCEG